MSSRTFELVSVALNNELLYKIEELVFHCNRLRGADPSRFAGKRMSRHSTLIYVIDHALRNGNAIPDLALTLSNHAILPRLDIKPSRAKGQKKKNAA